MNISLIKKIKIVYFINHFIIWNNNTDVTIKMGWGYALDHNCVSVGLSRKWDAREAGREVARSALKNLSYPPKCLLLFSTIHYADNGGLDELLKGVWDVLPKDTSLVGGTVPGFINNFGCFTRGTTAIAISHPKVDVAVGCGNNTKRNPRKAVEQSTYMLRNELDSSKYTNKFTLNFVSGPQLLSIPGIGYKKVINSAIISTIIRSVFNFSHILFQKGIGREDEILEQAVKSQPDYKTILGTSMDDYKGIRNFQFFNNEVLTNSLVNLGISTDMEIDVKTTHGMKKTEINFDITKLSRNRHIIHSINNKPAIKELSRLLNWPENFVSDKTLLHTILYYPISFHYNGREVPVVMPAVLKDSILTPCMIDDGKVSILTVNGKSLISSFNDCLMKSEIVKPEFGLFSTCITILQTLGYKVNVFWGELIRYFKEKPFIMFFSAGEGSYSQTKNLTYANMSFNSAIFGYNH